ncbi:DNA mismatch repair protein Mlh3-like [Amblyomma americanum]
MELKALPAEVIHKLRSGVAIVSLAHCMEELVLNALDAGATCIAVRLNMHYHKVQVVDNGHGMPADQLEKCGERYCTSKCRTLRDLDNPKYYGYRGEAISSIVEMSGLVQIESKSSTCAQSWCKTFSLGKLRDLAPSATNRPSVGTTVTILDFMYNLPVRRGSVSEAIDFEFCLQHLEGIALSHPEVSFTLRNDVTGEKHFQTHKTNSVLDIFAQLFGARKAATLKQASLKKKRFALEAYISLEGHTTKQLQFVYLNKRLLLKTRIHKLVHNVIKKYVLGFQTKSTQLPGSPSKQRNKQPVFVIFVNCSSRTFDITYEPQKTFVEFTDWDEVTKMFEQLLNGFLREHGVINHNFVISGELVFSQKTSPECEALARADLNINVEEVPNVLVSMKVCRKGPHDATVSVEEQCNAEQEVCTPAEHSTNKRLSAHGNEPPVQGVDGKASLSKDSNREVRNPKVAIALPPSFSLSANKRSRLCVQDKDSLFDISQKFRFSRRGKARGTCPEQKSSTNAALHHVHKDHTVIKRTRQQNNLKKKKTVASSEQVDKPQHLIHEKPSCPKGLTSHMLEKMPHQEKDAPVVQGLEKPTEPVAEPSTTSERPRRKQHGEDSSEGTSGNARDNSVPIILNKAPCHSYHPSEIQAKPSTCRGSSRKHHNEDCSVVTCDNASTPNKSVPVILSKAPCHAYHTSEISDSRVPLRHTVFAQPTPLATKLRRRMKACPPPAEAMSTCIYDTSSYFSGSNMPSPEEGSWSKLARCCPTSESFMQTASNRCLCLQVMKPCPVHHVDVPSNKVVRPTQPTFHHGQQKALHESEHLACHAVKLTPQPSLPLPFTCIQYAESFTTSEHQGRGSNHVVTSSGNCIEGCVPGTMVSVPSAYMQNTESCSTLEGQSKEAMEFVESTQPFALNLETNDEPADTELASQSDSVLGIDITSSSNGFSPSMMSEDEPAGVDHAMPALIPNCVNNGPKDRPVPSTARRYFSLGQLNLTLNNRPRVDQEDVKRSPFSKNVQSVTPVQATLSRTSPVAYVAQPSAGNNSSSSTEIAEYELGGLTQPSPRESQLQQSGNSHGEPDAIDISTVQQQVSDPIEGTCVDVEDQPGIVDGPGNVGDNTATVEFYPGDWASCVDPMTGEKVFINMTSGNSCFTLPPLCLEPDAPVAEPPNVTSLRTSFLAPAPSVPQFLPRPQDERTRFGCTPDPEQADVADMVRVWNNPVFACNTGQDIANGGLLSKENCTAALYKITQLYKFTKEMLAYVKVIGQVDAKFIACLMPLSHNGVVQEESLVVLFDQHAAHERVRLEWLLENQYEARGQAKCVRSSSLKTELTVALEPNTLRRAALCEKEMRRLGIHYTVHDCCLSFTRLPVCLLEREEGEQRAGRPSTLASRMEELVRDHTETLLGTRHSAIALPKFLMDVLSSQACHGAIRFGSVLEKHECVKILKALSKCRLPFQCAHGRPSLTPIVDLRFLPSEEKGQQRPNLAGLHARLKGNGNNGETTTVSTG